MPAAHASRTRAIVAVTASRRLLVVQVHDTIELLCRNGCGSAALQAASALLEGRLASATDPTSSKLYSEIAELKFRLLTQGQVADSSAAAAHLEEVIESQARGRQLATPETLRRFARKLWNSGCAHADAGQLHHAIEDIERANRFLEASGSAQAELATTLSTLSHVYLSTDRFDVAVERAERALQLLSSDAGAELELPGQAKAVRSQADPACLARIVLIKAHLRLGQAKRSRQHIDGLLSAQPQHDHVLVGAVCEEIVAMGQGYEAAVVALLERFVTLLDSAPHGAPERSKLAGATRSLITYREAHHKHRGATSLVSAEGANAVEACGQSGAGESDNGLLQLRQKLMADICLVARRASQLGASAVCDGSTHLEWLAQKAWDEGVVSAKAGSAKQLELAVQVLQAHGLLLKSLFATDDRRESRLRSHMVITHCSLALYDLLEVGQDDGPFGGNEDRRHVALLEFPDAETSATGACVHLQRAAESLADAFRLRQRGSFESSALAKTESASTALFDPDVSLCVLNFEVSLRRRDPNLNALLSRATETGGVRVTHFMVMAESARKRHNVETQRTCLEHALRLLLRAESRDYASIALVLRRLIHTCGSREEQLPHFQVMSDSLSAYSAANCPLDAELLQWYLSSSYNMAVAYFNDKELELAEKWFSMAFKFLHLAPPALQSSREELMQSYDLVMKELSASRAYGQGRAATQSFYARMKQLVTSQTLEEAPDTAVPP
jgi:tetratricopeptide (TPR) repeat protein